MSENHRSIKELSRDLERKSCTGAAVGPEDRNIGGAEGGRIEAGGWESTASVAAAARPQANDRRIRLHTSTNHSLWAGDATVSIDAEKTEWWNRSEAATGAGEGSRGEDPSLSAAEKGGEEGGQNERADRNPYYPRIALGEQYRNYINMEG